MKCVCGGGGGGGGGGGWACEWYIVSINSCLKILISQSFAFTPIPPLPPLHLLPLDTSLEPYSMDACSLVVPVDTENLEPILVSR